MVGPPYKVAGELGSLHSTECTHVRYESQCVFFCHLHLDWFIDHSLEFPREKSGQSKVGDIPTLSVSIRISARSSENVSMQ